MKPLSCRVYPVQMRTAQHKNGHPPKTCDYCGLEFEWRKKWERDWEGVKYCSKRCKKASKTARSNP